MKFFASLAVTLLSLAASATPAVGDYVRFDVAVYAAGSNTPGYATLEQTLAAFNQATNQYTEVTTTTPAVGQASQSVTQEAASNFVTDASIAQMLGNCGQFAGQLATVNTPVGVFTTCAIPVDNATETATYWIGAVPFGIVQADIISKADGSHTQALLNSYRAGVQ